MTTPDATIARDWFLGPDASRSVRWYSNDCVIILNALFLAIYTISPAEVAHIAALIADECLTEEESYKGGVGFATIPGGRIMIILRDRNDPHIAIDSSRL